MRFSHIKSLVDVDLLQANRQMNTGDRAKKLEKKNVYWRMLLQNGLIIVLFAVMFGGMLSNLPLAQYPGIFSETIGFMILFSVLQLYQSIYSLFYDNVNLTTYLALPFSLSELFASKFVTILLMSFAYFMSPLVLIIILGWQTGHSLFLAIPIGLISTFLIMMGTILSVFLVLHLIHQWSFFRKHKNIFMIAIYLLFFGLLFYNIYGNDAGEVLPGIGIVDSEVNPLFVGFHEIFIPGMRLSGWMKVGLWLVVVNFFSYIVLKWLIPQLYFEEEQPVARKNSSKEKPKSLTFSSNSKWQVFAKYQMRQLTDTTLILQMLFSKFYLPFIMIAPVLFNDAIIDLSILETIPHLWGSFLIIGLAIGFIMVTESSISGVIISFDKENYYYIQSLPISFRGYLKFKFYFAFLIEWVLGAIAVLGIALYIGLNMLPLLFILAGYSVGTYLITLYYYMRDYRLLDLTWSNFTELMQRGVSQAVRIFSQILIIFVGVFTVIMFLFWFIFVITEFIRLLLSIGTVIVVLLLVLGFNKYANRKFWSQFNK